MLEKNPRALMLGINAAIKRGQQNLRNVNRTPQK
jgi:hypothetical protein